MRRRPDGDRPASAEGRSARRAHRACRRARAKSRTRGILSDCEANILRLTVLRVNDSRERPRLPYHPENAVRPVWDRAGHLADLDPGEALHVHCRYRPCRPPWAVHGASNPNRHDRTAVVRSSSHRLWRNRSRRGQPRRPPRGARPRRDARRRGRSRDAGDAPHHHLRDTAHRAARLVADAGGHSCRPGRGGDRGTRARSGARPLPRGTAARQGPRHPDARDDPRTGPRRQRRLLRPPGRHHRPGVDLACPAGLRIPPELGGQRLQRDRPEQLSLPRDEGARRAVDGAILPR